MRDMRSRRLVGVLVALGLLGGGWGYASARADDGCGPVEGSIIESKDFTPAELQRSSMDPTLNRDGDSMADLGVFDGHAQVDGLPLWWVDTATTDDGLSQGTYYLDAPVGPLLGSEFVDAGGIQLSKESVWDERYTIAYRLTMRADRGVAVEVGSHEGMVVWADPDRTGTRTHNLYWSDGAFNYALIAERSAEEILALGRSLVCAG